MHIACIPAELTLAAPEPVAQSHHSSSAALNQPVNLSPAKHSELQRLHPTSGVMDKTLPQNTEQTCGTDPRVAIDRNRRVFSGFHLV